MSKCYTGRVVKKGLLIILIFLFSAVAFAADLNLPLKMKDVPDDHWAAASVYDLIKMGVTKGYPDGTYRGNKPITRYETAIFLSKLAKSVNGEDIKAEIKELRDQIVEIKKASTAKPAITGVYEGDWKTANLLSSQGNIKNAVGSYRLLLSGQHTIADNAKIKINLDTMDYGYFDDGSAATPGRGLLASELVDIESILKLENNVDLTFTYGRGPKQHTADPTGVLPSEIGVTYIRPNPGIKAATNFSGADVSLGYYSLQGATFNNSGKVNTGQLTGNIAFNLPAAFKTLRMALTGDYVSQGLFSSDRDLRAKVDLTAPLGQKIDATGTVGMAGRTSNSMMVSGALNLKDLWDTGTVVTIRAAKIGSSYIKPAFAEQEFYFAGYDNFNRPLIGGTVQIGGVLTQAVSDRVKIIGKGELRLSGDYKYEGANARLTAEGGISYDIAPNANFDIAYRVHQDKATNDTSDMAAFGLLYKF